MRLVRWNRPAWPSIFDDEELWNWSGLPSVVADTGLNVYETDDSVVVEASVPGVSEDNIEVSVEGNLLSISASQEETEEEKNKKKVVYKSTRRSSFNYSTTLPRMVDGSKADAEMENGVLKITVPKLEEEKPKKIKVSKKGS